MAALAFALGICSGLVHANAGDASKCPSTLARSIPARPASAPGGADFARSIGAEGSQSRETAVRDEILRGNVPRFLRGLKPVELSQRLPDGRTLNGTICVMPDYLAIGEDRDFLRMPMNLPTASSIAERLGFMLPTRKMVDAIYQQSDVQLRPQPMQPGPQMTTIDYFVRHNHNVAQQIGSLNAPLGVLIAGNKKDVVISNRLATRPGQIAIYGWHKPDGNPIQPLSTVHGATYADYSHGIRLVSDTMYIDGRRASVRTVLQDPDLADILSDEGPVTTASLLTP